MLISCHVCHPSLCNDNLSGIGVARFSPDYLGPRRRRYSYRFLFIPGTIGAIAWLARNQQPGRPIKHGLVAHVRWRSGPIPLQKKSAGHGEIDRVVAHVLRHGRRTRSGFSPYGYDERQYCSPGFNLPVGCLMRAVGQFPEYHTSADNLEFVTPEALEDRSKRAER